MSKTKKIQANYLHFCDFASMSDRGKPNLLGIFKSIFAKNMPATHPQFYVVFSITTYQAIEDDFELKIVHKDEKEEIFSQKFPLKVNLPENKEKSEFTSIIGINNLQFKSFGIHNVKLLIGNKKIAETELNVEKQKEEN